MELPLTLTQNREGVQSLPPAPCRQEDFWAVCVGSAATTLVRLSHEAPALPATPAALLASHVAKLLRVDLSLSDTKARAACTRTVGPATFWTSFMGRNTKVSKQKIHALLHSSHSTGDKLKFPAHRHDTALQTRRWNAGRAQPPCVQCGRLVPDGAPASPPQGVLLLVTLHQGAKARTPNRWKPAQCALCHRAPYGEGGCQVDPSLCHGASQAWA